MQVLKIIFNDFTCLVMFILPIGRVIDFSPGTLKVSLIDLLEVGIEKLLWSINSTPKNLQILITVSYTHLRAHET